MHAARSGSQPAGNKPPLPSQDQPMSEDEALDEALDETFPASDPIAPSQPDDNDDRPLPKR